MTKYDTKAMARAEFAGGIDSVGGRIFRKIATSRKRQKILEIGLSTNPYWDEESLELKELKIVIQDFIKTLPPKATAIFILSREDYLRHGDIAKQLGISEKNVQNHLTVTLRKLRSYLTKISYWSIILFFSIRLGYTPGFCLLLI